MSKRIGSNTVYSGFHGFKMTTGIEKAADLSAKFSFTMAAAAMLLALSACAGGPAADSQSSASSVAAGNVVGPRDTGTFPNLNIKPGQAAPQFTDSEAKAKLAALEADRRTAQNPGRAAGARNDSAALRKLGATHAKDTLREIEGKCDPALDPTCK